MRLLRWFYSVTHGAAIEEASMDGYERGYTDALEYIVTQGPEAGFRAAKAMLGREETPEATVSSHGLMDDSNWSHD